MKKIMKKIKSVTMILISVVIVLGITSLAVSANNVMVDDTAEINKVETEQISNEVILFNDKEVFVYYDDVCRDDTLSSECYVYRDLNNNEYIMNEKGEVIGFLSTDSAEIMVAELFDIDYKNICEKFLNSQLGDISSYQYFGETFLEDLGYYELVYYKLVGGIKSSDFIFVDIDTSGKILAFAAPNINCFSGINIPNIVLEDYQSIIEDKIIQSYPNMINYQVTDTFVQLNDNALELVIYFEVNFLYNKKEYLQSDTVVIEIGEI